MRTDGRFWGVGDIPDTKKAARRLERLWEPGVAWQDVGTGDVRRIGWGQNVNIPWRIWVWGGVRQCVCVWVWQQKSSFPDIRATYLIIWKEEWVLVRRKDRSHVNLEVEKSGGSHRATWGGGRNLAATDKEKAMRGALILIPSTCLLL